MSDAANTPTPPATPASDAMEEVSEQPTMPLEMPLASDSR